MNRFFNLGLLVSFFICYANWGHPGFIPEIEYSLFTDPHALTLFIQNPIWVLVIPGQFIFLAGIFVGIDSNRLTMAGLILIGVTVLLIFGNGIVSGNIKMILFAVPFLTIATIWLLKFRKKGKEA
jgi:hypothetical protein